MSSTDTTPAAAATTTTSSRRNGSFVELSWREDPAVSYSDWSINVVRVHTRHSDDDHQAKKARIDTTTGTTETGTTDTYHVHRNILALGPRHSAYFAAQFQSPMQESVSRQTIIELDDSQAHVFPLVLDFLYSGKLPDHLTPDVAAALHSLAEYFDMEQLREEVQEFYRSHVTMENSVDFVQNAQIQYADRLLRITVEAAVDHLWQIQPETARQVGPLILLDILGTNANNDRSYGLHTSKLVAECCQHNKEDITAEIFRALTDVEILPYLEATAAIYLLGMEPEICGNDKNGSSSAAQGESDPGSSSDDDKADPSKKDSKSDCFHQRCTDAITVKWPKVRKLLLGDSRLNQAFERIPSSIMITILMRIGSTPMIQAMAKNVDSADDEDDTNERESPDMDMPRILLRKAGTDVVNGLYALDNREYNGATKYTRPGEYQGKSYIFAIYRRRKAWWLSAIPTGQLPGTNGDIHLYWTGDGGNWKARDAGNEPAPQVMYL